MVVACVQASVKARRPQKRAHGILMPHQDCQLNITVQGVQLKRTTVVTRSYQDNHCLSFVSIQAWRRNFHRRCECSGSVSDPKGLKT